MGREGDDFPLHPCCGTQAFLLEDIEGREREREREKERDRDEERGVDNKRTNDIKIIRK